MDEKNTGKVELVSAAPPAIDLIRDRLSLAAGYSPKVRSSFEDFANRKLSLAS